MIEALARQDFSYDSWQETPRRFALPELAISRILPAARDDKHSNYRRPEQAEFVTSSRKCPHIADVKMAAPQHRHQQVDRCEQGNGAREETQNKAYCGYQLDRAGEQYLQGRQVQAQTREIHGINLELVGTAENVAGERGREH